MTAVDDAALANMLAALGHPLRLRVFKFVMRQGPEGVPAGEIARALAIGASNLSFHLKELRHAEWIESQRQGQQIVYRACYDRVQVFLDTFQDQCCADAPTGCTPVCGPACAETSKETEQETT